MCESSLHVMHRKATSTEKLEVRQLPNIPHLKGLYPTEGSDQRLVCTLPGSKAVIAEVSFIPNTHPSIAPITAKWAGASNVEVTLLQRSGYSDYVQMPDNSRLPLGVFALGTKLSIGYPVITGVEGVKAVQKALDEHDKTRPTMADTIVPAK